VGSPVPGNLWKVLVGVGDAVQEGQTVAVVESMKMEFPVLAPCAGKVLSVPCKEGSGVTAGQAVVTLR
jgi:urea carboxylase